VLSRSTALARLSERLSQELSKAGPENRGAPKSSSDSAVTISATSRHQGSLDYYFVSRIGVRVCCERYVGCRRESRLEQLVRYF